MPDPVAALKALAAHPFLAIDPRYIAHVMAVAEGREQPRAARAPIVLGRPVMGTTVAERIGIVPVMGPIITHTDPVAEFFDGAVSIDGLRASVRALADSAEVDAVCFLGNTPGGSVEGCTDLAAEIFALRSVKPTMTIACGGIYSAGYWVLSAAHEVWLPVDGGVGSIGIKAMHVDQSEWLKQMGLNVSVFTSGDKKDWFSSLKPLSDEEQQALQADVDAHAKRFFKDVARHRGLDVATVRGFEGGVFDADGAVKAKLANGIKTLDAAFTALRKSASTGTTTGRGRTASQKETVMPDPETPAAGSNVIPISEAHRMRDEAKEAGAREASERFASITAMCTKAEFPELAAGMVARKLTLEQATAELDTCGGIKDAAFAGKLSEEQTKALIAQVATGLTLREANAKIVAIQAAGGGPEISGRHAPAGDRPTAKLPSARELYQARRDTTEKARAANPLLAGAAR